MTDEKLPDNLPGLNIKDGLKRVVNNAKLYTKLLNDLVDKNLDFHKKIKEELGKGELEGARRIAHTLKGSSINLGAEAIHESSKDLEMAIKENRLDGIEPMIEDVQSRIMELKDTLEKNGLK